MVEVAREADEEVAEVKERLATVSNRKLLRLAEVGAAIKEKYGSKDKLVAAVSQALGKAKDKDYVARLRQFSSARLLDMARGADRRARRTRKAAS